MKQLAIVIPAYKIEYFRSTLESLAAQTCKDFTVYIGDDCSNAPFRDMINGYTDKIDVRYIRFEQNMGGKDLVAQWQRCIELTEGEPWLWLFSDDDVMSPDCVEKFYQQLDTEESYDVYHFNVKVIDSQDSVIRSMTEFPAVIDSETLYKRKTANTLDSFVVEYIFSREVYMSSGGFVQYDMAWNSDLATWMKLGRQKGIKTINGAYVYWRQSDINITPNLSNDIVFRKLNIDVDFIAWARELLPEVKRLDSHNRYALLRLVIFYCQTLDSKQMKEILDKAERKMLINGWYRYTLLKALPLLRLLRTIKHRNQKS